ncbi:Purine catabolism regulatory protein-like family protein [Actinacidiphila rubida]|uniref:Purine catabolism regulatory protein-like family protein n=1 Tax=Actinacidiphila rubida TaxID=310780 RepID=A0A1H8S255_9ACTN|nr:PucR family transcriptional regulator ligand-binding domain-containing protein [Actinacidiphila rubida]SEO72428.1 Purine catabolism regulatory protein-like family protein [Actinacidiphila rubida]
MPLTVRDLLAIPSLRLELAAGRDGLGNVVEAAHASEMLRPAAWLEGAEVVMTTGLLLAEHDRPGTRDTQDARDAPDAWAQYAADVAGGGAAALILGLGRPLPLQDVPPALARAADDLGLPLLTAPERTPFVAVTKAVFGARAAEERRLLERTLRTQRRLTAATASGDGLDALLRAWQQATGTAVVVCDALGRLLGAAGTDGAAAITEAAGILDAVALRGLRGSADGDLSSGRVQVQPLGANRLRGFVLLLGAGNAESRLLGSVLVSLLSVELDAGTWPTSPSGAAAPTSSPGCSRRNSRPTGPGRCSRRPGCAAPRSGCWRSTRKRSPTSSPPTWRWPRPADWPGSRADASNSSSATGWTSRRSCGGSRPAAPPASGRRSHRSTRRCPCARRTRCCPPAGNSAAR